MSDYFQPDALGALVISAIGVVVSILLAKQQAQTSIKAARFITTSSSDLRQALENLYAAETSLKFLLRNKADISDEKQAEDRLAVLEYSLLSLGLLSNRLPFPHQVCEIRRNWAAANSSDNTYHPGFDEREEEKPYDNDDEKSKHHSSMKNAREALERCEKNIATEVKALRSGIVKICRQGIR